MHQLSDDDRDWAAREIPLETTNRSSFSRVAVRASLGVGIPSSSARPLTAADQIRERGRNSLSAGLEGASYLPTGSPRTGYRPPFAKRCRTLGPTLRRYSASGAQPVVVIDKKWAYVERHGNRITDRSERLRCKPRYPTTVGAFTQERASF